MEMASSIKIVLATALVLFMLPYSECECKQKYTNWDFEGNGEGEVQYLDRHHVDCHGGALSYVKLERRSGKMFLLFFTLNVIWLYRTRQEKLQNE